MLKGFEKIEIEKAEPLFVSISGKYIRFSKAAGAHIGDRVSLYENGRMLAFNTESDGQLKVSIIKRSGTKFITSIPLSEMIMKKYNCKTGTKLKAWVDDGVLVFSLS